MKPNSGRWLPSLLWLLVWTVSGTAAAASDEVSRGAEVYRNYCLSCHGDSAAGLAAFDGDLEAFRQRLTGTQNMPDMSGVLLEQEVTDVFAYLRSTQGR